MLLERGANKALKNAAGKSPLDVATEADALEYIELLK